mgnify:CR=1 FL=1
MLPTLIRSMVHGNNIHFCCLPKSLNFKHMYMYVDCGGNGEHKMNTQTVVTHAYGSRPRF